MSGVLFVFGVHVALQEGQEAQHRGGEHSVFCSAFSEKNPQIKAENAREFQENRSPKAAGHVAEEENTVSEYRNRHEQSESPAGGGVKRTFHTCVVGCAVGVGGAMTSNKSICARTMSNNASRSSGSMK
nr:MAG TPA: hypothetical protein [Caudoviricetes sp.]